MNTHLLSSEHSETSIKYVCGIDIGSLPCSGCILRPNKETVVKPTTFANTKDGWNVFLEQLERLEADTFADHDRNGGDLTIPREAFL